MSSRQLSGEAVHVPPHLLLILLYFEYLPLRPNRLFLDLEQLTSVIPLILGPSSDLLLQCSSFLQIGLWH